VIASDLELGDLEEVVDGLAFDVGEELQALDFCLRQPDLASERPVEILDLDPARYRDVLSDV